jgi:hypothetical protein
VFFEFPTMCNANMTDAHRCEVGVTLQPLNIRSYGDVR